MPPEGIVILIQKNNEASGLRVERRGNVKNSLFSDLGDSLVGDGSLLVERVVGAALLDRIQEGLLGRHG
jgi:hypothetical protein